MDKKLLLLVTFFAYQTTFCMKQSTQHYAYEELSKKTTKVAEIICPIENLSNLKQSELEEKIKQLSVDISNKKKEFRHNEKYYYGAIFTLLLSFPLATYLKINDDNANIGRLTLIGSGLVHLIYKIYKTSTKQEQLTKLNKELAKKDY